jgi:two-component sensor histidine kinase
MTLFPSAGLSLTTRLALFALVAWLPALAVIWYLETELRSAREAEVLEAARRQTQRAASELDRFLEGSRMMMTAVSTARGVRRFEEDSCSAFLAGVTENLPSIRSMVVVGPDRSLHCRPSQTDQIGEIEKIDPQFLADAVAAPGFRIGRYTRFGAMTTEAGLPIALSATLETGETMAVVATVEVRYLADLAARWTLAPQGALTLADADGVILARAPFPERFVGTRVPDAFQGWVRGTEIGVARARSQDGTVRITAYKPAALEPAGLYLSTGIAEAAAFASIDATRRQGIAIILAGGILALVGGLWAGRRFVRRPVAGLLALAEAWRQGRRGEVSDMPGDDEFGAIAESLDRMGAELGRREEHAVQSEARLRRTILAAPHPFMLHAEDGTVLAVSDSWIAQSGLPRTALTSSIEWLRDHVRRDGPNDPVQSPFGQSVVVGGMEREVVTAGGETRIWDFSIVPLEPLADGRSLCLTTAVDVTDRYHAAEQQSLLLRELDHRVKNTLANVQAIASQTFRSTPDPEAFRQKFSERLGALARTHDMLTRGQWRGVSLAGMVASELAHVPNPERIAVRGEDCTLPAGMAVPLGLILHELTTNAVKYGALSQSDGRLFVGWSLPVHAGEGRSMQLDWVESGGPAVEPPVRSGFGSRLIAQLSRSLGAGESRFEPGGVVFRLRIDLPDGADAAESVPI